MTELSLPAIDDAWLGGLVDIAREAGALAMSYFRTGARTDAKVEWKAGGSPVTQADFAVDRFLRERLPEHASGIGWLSEETADTPDRLAHRALWVSDPIDGTRAFMEGDPRFAVAIALVVDGRPVAGVVEAPAVEQTFWARAGAGAWLNGSRIAFPPRANLREGKLAGPKFLIDPLARRLGMDAQPKFPSLALRFARLAAGEFAAAIASTDAHDWDIAASDLLIEEAGAVLHSMEGQRLTYNRPDPTHGVLAATAPPLQEALRGALRQTLNPDRRPAGRARV